MAIRYYFLKIPKDFFKTPAMRYIKSLALGGEILLLYLQLLIESTDQEGLLRLTDEIAYTWETLAATMGMSVDSVSEGMKVLTSLGMVKILPDDTIFLPDQERFTQSEAASTQRSRDKRARDALQRKEKENGCFNEEEAKIKEEEISACKAIPLHCNTDAPKRNVEKEIEKEIDIDIEKEKEKEKEKSALQRPKAKSNAFLEMLREES